MSKPKLLETEAAQRELKSRNHSSSRVHTSTKDGKKTTTTQHNKREIMLQLVSKSFFASSLLFFCNEAVNDTKPLSSQQQRSDLLLLLSYRWGLIGVVECSRAGCRTVRVLNQKVSLLLIIHNATNSRGLSVPPASLNILAAMQR